MRFFYNPHDNCKEKKHALNTGKVKNKEWDYSTHTKKSLNHTETSKRGKRGQLVYENMKKINKMPVKPLYISIKI